jgi:AcrR family transcriptional regulator
MTAGAGSQRVPHGEGREALMRATVKVVARDGLRGFTYRAVAREAGVANTLIAHHFGSAKNLLQATVEMAAEVSLEGELGAVTADLESLGRSIGPAVARDPDLQVFQYEMLLAARHDPELRPVLERIYDTYRDGVRRELARMGFDEPGDSLARLVFALIDGLVLQQVLFEDADATDRTLDRLRRLLRADGGS